MNIIKINIIKTKYLTKQRWELVRDMYEKAKGRYAKHIDFIMLDFFMIQCTFWLIYIIKYGLESVYLEQKYLQYSIVLGVLDLFLVLCGQPYQDILERGAFKELQTSIIHVSYVVLISVLYIFLSGLGKVFSRLMFIEIWSIGITMVFISRLLWKGWIRKHINTWRDKRHIMLVSTQNEAYKTMQNIAVKEYRSYEIDEIILLEEKLDETEMMGVEVALFEEEALYNYLKTHIVDEVFINLPREIKIPETLLKRCYQMGLTVHIKLIDRPYEIGTKVLEDLAGYQVLTSGMKIAKPYEIFLKRALDIVGGLIGSLVTIFLIMVIGPIIYFKDPGPIFFSQVRMGKNGRKFKIYKFRSMYMDAEKRKKELMAHNEMQGLMFKMTDDPRVIKGIGDKIRTWSIDEFPQFFNVLKGEMSLVGTRPPTVDEWEQYEEHHYRRLGIKPGLTGMWQVSGRNEITDFEEVVALDTKYITEWSIALDIKILIKTVAVVVMKVGSR